MVDLCVYMDVVKTSKVIELVRGQHLWKMRLNCVVLETEGISEP